MTALRAKKSLGQHWLTDRSVLRRIAAACEITPEDTVVEIGPGKGALTDALLQRSTRLIAVELDSALVAALREKYSGRPGVVIVEGDAAALSPEEVLRAGGGGVPYVVAGNLPYNAGTAIIRRYLRGPVRPRRMVVMLQSEVAERIAAKPGAMSYLAAEMQLYAEPRVLFRIPARAFRPPPKVQSAVLLLDVRDSPDVEVDDAQAFLGLVQAGFAAPRKRLRNSLAIGLRVGPGEAGEVLAAAGVDPDQRPQMLGLEDWRDVYLAWRGRGAA